MKWYAVAHGRQTGIFETWSEAEANVKAFPGARFKSFSSRRDAEEWLDATTSGRSSGLTRVKITKSPFATKPSLPAEEPAMSKQSEKYFVVSGAHGKTLFLSRSDADEMASEITKRAGEMSGENGDGDQPAASVHEFDSRRDAEIYMFGKSASVIKADAGKFVVERARKSPFRNEGRRGGDDALHVFTDGSRKDGLGGYAFFDGTHVTYGPVTNENLDESVRTAKNVSNNRGEITAVIRALETIERRPIVIESDSMYVIKTITEWLPGWKRRYGSDMSKWRTSTGQVPANLDLFVRARELYEADGVTLKHVRAHNGNFGNEIADKYADRGRFAETEITEKLY
jgi:ribonuclease HI